MNAESVETRRIVYDDGITRAFGLATVVWSLVAMAVGVLVATQLTFWQANFETSWLSFGRLRPLHTNAALPILCVDQWAGLAPRRFGCHHHK